MTPARHPRTETIRRFVLGCLDRPTMARVEGHLQNCRHCARVASEAPDDPFVALLRRGEKAGRRP
jgi:hypothetical protein